MQVLFPNTTSLWYAIVAGVICAIGFKASADALAIQTALVSIVVVLIATYPIISSSIGLVFLKEAEKIILQKFIFGMILVFIGGYLVANSIKEFK